MEGIQTTNLVKDIESCISKLGIMFRIFHREKTKGSLVKKLEKEPGKYGQEKKIQDLIGVRIALYFVDDIEVVMKALEERFNYVAIDSEVDQPKFETFKAVRCNLIFKLPEHFDFSNSLDEEHAALVDNTFEVQIRTILSEGWHEIDHDLRYKRKDDWIGFDRENRALNGVYATLETSEWTLLKLFEELAYKHYKTGNVSAMLHNKFRVRLKESSLDNDLIEYIGSNQTLIKRIYRFDRIRLLECISLRPYMPISISNLIFIMNLDTLNDPQITARMPSKFNIWWESAA
ncbi:RelA/SpoT domain-containing protein [Pseudomonas viridiflava]|uniref:RelA/SpoT domain-containing protein n=1 Tax=Pseudomonas viridiflava TaxID=33069 RepID=UPI000F03D897|nr:RelA/SpoT domain-containing protein [Pseudomonas viridiflava]